MPRHAHRLEKALLNREAGKQIGRILRRTEPGALRPIEFRRCGELDKARGFFLLHRHGRFYVGLVLFGRSSRYYTKVPIDSYIEWKTRASCSGSKPLLILPLEFSRDFHDEQFLQRGSPQSAKLICRRDDAGEEHFFVNVVFRFDPDPIETLTVLGIDRGWAKIASCTLIDFDRRVVQAGIDLEGSGFFAQQRQYEDELALAQSRGKVSPRKFRLRGRAADNALGEFANRLVAYAVEHRSQIVIERLNALSMSRFLRRSQIARLKDLLDYKTQAAGLPKPIEVPAAYSSQTCPECGHRDPQNRPKHDEQGKAIQHVFRCVRCGHEANADHNAARFIALRGLHRIQSKALGNSEFTFEAFLKWLVQ